MDIDDSGTFAVCRAVSAFAGLFTTVFLGTNGT
jgi:hypothetical protein